MEVYDRKSLGILVKGFKVFDEAAIEWLIHFVRVFEVYPFYIWQDCLNKKNAPVRFLILAARHPHWYERCLVAQNPKTPASILEVLMGDCSSTVRKCVEFNPNCPTRPF